MSKKIRFKLIVSAYLFLVRKGAVLLMKRKNTGYGDGYYGIPSGHLEENETIYDCMIREAREEIGIKIYKKDLEIVHIMHRKEADERIDFFFIAKEWRGDVKNMEPYKCSELAYHPLNDLPDDTIAYVREALSRMEQHELYSEYGWG